MDEENNKFILNERAKWIDYKGARIFLVDFSGLSEEGDLLKVMDGYIDELSKNEKRKMLSLIDLTNTKISMKLNEKGKQVMKISEGRVIDSAAALVGLESWQKILTNLIKKDKNIGFFDTVQAAKEWLIKQ